RALSGVASNRAGSLRLGPRGRDLYPDLQAFIESGNVPDDDLIRADLCRRFWYFLTQPTTHQAEYTPWCIPKGQVEPFHVPIGEYLTRVANHLDEYAETKRMLD